VAGWRSDGAEGEGEEYECAQKSVSPRYVYKRLLSDIDVDLHPWGASFSVAFTCPCQANNKLHTISVFARLRLVLMTSRDKKVFFLTLFARRMEEF
jgi:hypothetical protein